MWRERCNHYNEELDIHMHKCIQLHDNDETGYLTSSIQECIVECCHLYLTVEGLLIVNNQIMISSLTINNFYKSLL